MVSFGIESTSLIDSPKIEKKIGIELFLVFVGDARLQIWIKTSSKARIEETINPSFL